MIPPFDLQGGVWVSAARDLTVTALLSAFGTLVFRLVVLPRALTRAPADLSASLKRRLLRVSQASAAVALAAGIAWLCVQSADFADTDTAGTLARTVPKVLADTRFGHVIAAQLAMLVATFLLQGRRDQPGRQAWALAAATIALLLEAGHSHAASMHTGPSWLLAADIVHLLGAGAWLGGLLPLLLTIRHAPPPFAAAAARQFSPVGKLCLVALLVSAAYQSWVLVASVPGLVGTAYGWMALVKLALFAVLFCFALAHRYRFAPALLRHHPDVARAVLVRSIALQTGVALCIIVAAAILSGLPPSMHLQPLWPFDKQFSLDAIHEDADFAHEVARATIALAAAAVLLLLALAKRRFRLPALAAAALIAWFTIPHFDLLLADATPTSFYRSPTGFSADSIVAGRSLFAQHCAVCHGAGGQGDGPLARALPAPPANLTAAHLWMHSDGQLFWWLTSGIRTPEGRQAMPGFAQTLDEDQRWALIDYIHALNAGAAYRMMDAWPHPVQAPGLATRRPDPQARFVRLVIGPISHPLPPAPGLVTVEATDANLQAAYAILAGGAAPAGTQFLIDGDGWLRAMRPPGWTDPTALQAEIASLRKQPVKQTKMDDSMKDMKM